MIQQPPAIIEMSCEHGGDTGEVARMLNLPPSQDSSGYTVPNKMMN